MPQVALRLCSPKPATPGPVNLAFGAGDPCVIRLPPIYAEIVLRTLTECSISVSMPPISCSVSAEYDHAVWRGVSSLTSGGWQQAGGHDLTARCGHRQSANDRRTFDVPFLAAAMAPLFCVSGHGVMSVMTRPAVAVRYDNGISRIMITGWAWREMLRRPRLDFALGWDDGLDVYGLAAMPWQQMRRDMRPRVSVAWIVGNSLFMVAESGYQNRRRHRRAISAWWREGRDMYGWGGPWAIPPPPPPSSICYQPPYPVNLDLSNWLADDRLHLRFICYQAATQVVPRRRTYIVIHDIDVYRLPDNYPIHAASVALSLDADSWAWRFSATLLGRSALDAIQPGTDGLPVALAIEIDGHTWHVLAEEWSEDRSHGRRAVQVSGRGLTAWLGSPYILPSSGVTTAALTMQQLIEAHLPMGSGWVVDWQADDWLVPAGAWSWSNQAPIQAMHAAAQGVGLVLVPAKASKIIRVQPRYPVMPWEYAGATPAIILPDSAILSMSRRSSPPTQANAVYVHGGETGGIIARVKRTSTAGDRLAPAESSPLITHTTAARVLGSRILAAHHQQPAVNDITTTMGGPIPMAAIGQLLHIDAGADSARGVVNAVSIKADMGEAVRVRQTITIGEETPNLWRGFAELLPDEPTLLGQIIEAHADSTVTVQLAGGGTMRVRGTGSVGQRVYVRAGRIDGDAPNLPMYEIDV